MRLLRLPIVLFTFGWLVACHFTPSSPQWGAACCALVGLACAVAGVRRALTVAWPSLGVFAGVLSCVVAAQLEQPSRFSELVGEDRVDLLVEAVVIDGPRQWPHGSTFVVELLRVDRKTFPRERVRLYVGPANRGPQDLIAGDVVEIFGRASRFSPADFPRVEGARERQERKGLVGRIVALEPVLVRGRPWSVRRVLAERRVALEEATRDAMPRYGGIGVAMLTGSRGGIDDDLDQLFRDTGTAHVLAISGLHFGAIASLLWACGVSSFRRSTWVASRIGARRAASVFVALFLFLYLMLVGAPVSALRAWMMLVFVVGAVVVARRPSVWGALGMAAVALTIGNPQMTRDLGFQLSFTATSAIALFWYRRPHWLRADPYRFSPETTFSRSARACGSFVGVSWAATFATMPILAAYTGTVSVVSPVTNLLVVPCVSLVTFPALVAGSLFVHSVPPLGELCFAIADESLQLCVFALRSTVELVDPLVVVGSPGPVVVTMLLVAVSASLFLVGDVRLFVGALLVVVGISAGWVATATAPPDGVEVHFIPVGQGDAVLARGPRHTVLIDAGGSRVGRDPGRHVVVPYLRRIGVDSLDALVLTHNDFDHIGGAEAVLDSLDVAVVAREPVELGIAWLRIFRAAMEGSENNRSIVAVVTVGMARVTLPGDIEAAAERRGLERGQFQRSLVLKAPHHGSKTSSTSAFLDQTAPRVAIVSAGRHNRFGHPHRDVVERYEDRAVRLFSTATHGLVVLELTEEGTMAVRSVRAETHK